jgi:opacity protein-like surface antigen
VLGFPDLYPTDAFCYCFQIKFISLESIMRLLSLLIASAGLATPAIAQDWRGEIYGGSALSGDAFYRDTVYDLDQGTAFGLAVYRDFGAWELGADLMRTDRTYTGFANDLESLSLMLNGRYSFPLGGLVEGYVGAGLGAIRVSYAGTGADATFSGSDTVPGAQVSLGARYALAAGTFFSEVKYQKALDNASIDSVADTGVAQSYDSTSLVVGYRFSF